MARFENEEGQAGVNARFPLSVFAVSGYSGSGKTTLIEAALPVLKNEGFDVAVIKHSSSGFSLDTTGADTSRLFNAGAHVVVGHDGHAFFLRRGGGLELSSLQETVGTDHDLILLEGHKNWAVPRVWLTDPAGRTPPGDVRFLDELPWMPVPERLPRFLDRLHEEIRRGYEKRRLFGGILIGGESRRMGEPKALLRLAGQTLAERTAEIVWGRKIEPVLLGQGPCPPEIDARGPLPDIPGLPGPMGGLLSGMRWDPAAAWLLLAVDMPRLSPEVIRWVLSHRRPGVWAVMPRLNDGPHGEPLLAVYEPSIRSAIEALARQGVYRLQKLLGHPKVLAPPVPAELADAFMNVNTPGAWREELERSG